MWPPDLKTYCARHDHPHEGLANMHMRIFHMRSGGCYCSSSCACLSRRFQASHNYGLISCIGGYRQIIASPVGGQIAKCLRNQVCCYLMMTHPRAAGAVLGDNSGRAAVAGLVQDPRTTGGDLAVGPPEARLTNAHPFYADPLRPHIQGTSDLRPCIKQIATATRHECDKQT